MLLYSAWQSLKLVIHFLCNWLLVHEQSMNHISLIKKGRPTCYAKSPTVHAVTLVIIRLTHANVWESMGKHCSCMQFIKSRIFYYKSRENPYQYYKSRENPYQVLQVMHAASERAMKLKVRMIKSLSP